MKYRIIKATLEYSIDEDIENRIIENIDNYDLFDLLVVDNESQAKSICFRLNLLQSLNQNSFIIENEDLNEMIYYYYLPIEN